jgi:hypothetical protein
MTTPVKYSQGTARKYPKGQCAIADCKAIEAMFRSGCERRLAVLEKKRSPSDYELTAIRELRYSLYGTGKPVNDRVFFKEMPLHVDHCHRHGWIRGTLCTSHNMSMKGIDKNLIIRYLPRQYPKVRDSFVRHYNACPDCADVEILFTSDEIYSLTSQWPYGWNYTREYQRWELANLAASRGMTFEEFRKLAYAQNAIYISDMARRYPSQFIPEFTAAAEPDFRRVLERIAYLEGIGCLHPRNQFDDYCPPGIHCECLCRDCSKRRK